MDVEGRGQRKNQLPRNQKHNYEGTRLLHSVASKLLRTGLCLTHLCSGLRSWFTVGILWIATDLMRTSLPQLQCFALQKLVFPGWYWEALQLRGPMGWRQHRKEPKVPVGAQKHGTWGLRVWEQEGWPVTHWVKQMQLQRISWCFQHKPACWVKPDKEIKLLNQWPTHKGEPCKNSGFQGLVWCLHRRNVHTHTHQILEKPPCHHSKQHKYHLSLSFDSRAPLPQPILHKIPCKHESSDKGPR